jgi:CHAT domain-containing protein
LPFAAQEAEEVVAPIPTGKWSSYSGLQASPENFLRAAGGRYRIVHVITHALNNDRDPNLSGLILSLVGPSGERRDGFLQLGTIYDAHLKAELIVLSACETAEGQELSNEGLMGLTSAFLYAGAGRVLSTAWKIDDEGTSEFMGRFYRALYGPPRRTPTEALRIAQLEMRQTPRWKSPFYWSGFLLHGDWSWTW